LLLDLARVLRDGPASAPHLLVLMDLNGFKSYNDRFGHGAGDELLASLGAALAAEVGAHGVAYRLGGDEFCVLAQSPVDHKEVAARWADALTARGPGYHVTAAYGAVVLPEEAGTDSAGLALADQRMYRNKSDRQPAGAR
jgi:two-component system cell cycle response regulator